MRIDDVLARARRHRGHLLLLGLVVVGLLVGITVAGGWGDDPRVGAAGPSSTASSTPATGSAPADPTPTRSPVPVPVESPAQVPGVPASFAAVGLRDAADAGGGLAVVLSAVRPMNASARGPGNVAGPALAVTVRVTNGTGAPLPLAEVEVALGYTAEEVAASPVDDDAASPLRGTLADGDSAEGTYVFSVPAEQREVVTVTVGLLAGAPLLVFTGAVA